MCFNKEFTFIYTLISVAIGAYIFIGKGIWGSMEKWRRVRISACFFFFAFMEGIQFIDYLVINQCGNLTNIIWTQLGYYHICFQPLFSNLAFSALDSKNLNKQRETNWQYIFYLCIITGALMALRMFIPSITDSRNQFMKICTEHIEGFCGPKTCSMTGNYHIKWSFKLLKPSYVFPSIASHFLNMFITPILMGQTLGSVVLFLSGPFIAALFDASSGEKASIWCFFSICEVCITSATQYIVCKKGAKDLKSNNQSIEVDSRNDNVNSEIDTDSEFKDYTKNDNDNVEIDDEKELNILKQNNQENKRRIEQILNLKKEINGPFYFIEIEKQILERRLNE